MTVGAPVGSRGPARVPFQVLKGRGSRLGKKRESTEPQAPPVEKLPTAPKWLDRTGGVCWRRLVKALDGLGLLADADRGIMERYCQAWSDWRAALKDCKENGRYQEVETKQGDFVQQIRAAARDAAILNDQIHRMEGQMGLTASARASLKVEKPKAKSDAGGYAFAQ